MGNKKIKHLKRRKNKYKKLKKIFYILFLLLFILILIKSLKYVKEMYIAKNIEDSKIEFYMDIADEAGNNKIQLNWKELLAIDMTIYNGDLSSVKKSEALSRAKKFIKYSKDKLGKLNYELNDFDEVLEEHKFTEKQKLDVNKNLKNLKYTYLGNKKLNEKSSEVVFINKIKSSAIKNYEMYGILPSITIGQCILESGWGNSELTKKGNNLFGIKSDSSWKGDSISMKTSENYDDKIVASFRSYSSIEESIKDHGKFLKENPRYEKNGMFLDNHYITQAQALEDAGYSTKKDKYGNRIYADLLIDLIRRYNLQLIDCELYENK